MGIHGEPQLAEAEPVRQLISLINVKATPGSREEKELFVLEGHWQGEEFYVQKVISKAEKVSVSIIAEVLKKFGLQDVVAKTLTSYRPDNVNIDIEIDFSEDATKWPRSSINQNELSVEKPKDQRMFEMNYLPRAEVQTTEIKLMGDRIKTLRIRALLGSDANQSAIKEFKKPEGNEVHMHDKLKAAEEEKKVLKGEITKLKGDLERQKTAHEQKIAEVKNELADALAEPGIMGGKMKEKIAALLKRLKQ